MVLSNKLAQYNHYSKNESKHTDTSRLVARKLGEVNSDRITRRRSNESSDDELTPENKRTPGAEPTFEEMLLEFEEDDLDLDDYSCSIPRGRPYSDFTTAVTSRYDTPVASRKIESLSYVETY